MRLAPPLVHDNTQYNIVVVGDSIDGVNYGNWQTQLLALFPGKKIRLLNLSVDGRKIGGSGTTMLTPAQSAIVDAAVLPNAVNILLMGGGTNDVCAMVADGRSTTDIHNDTVTYITGRQSAGYNYVVRRFIVDREQPSCAAVTGGYFISTRTTLHGLDATYCAASGIYMVRCDTNALIGVSGQASDSTYFIQGADPVGKVHLNDTGAGVLAGLFKTQLDEILYQ